MLPSSCLQHSWGLLQVRQKDALHKGCLHDTSILLLNPANQKRNEHDNSQHELNHIHKISKYKELWRVFKNKKQQTRSNKQTNKQTQTRTNKELKTFQTLSIQRSPRPVQAVLRGTHGSFASSMAEPSRASSWTLSSTHQQQSSPARHRFPAHRWSHGRTLSEQGIEKTDHRVTTLPRTWEELWKN